MPRLDDSEQFRSAASPASPFRSQLLIAWKRVVLWQLPLQLNHLGVDPFGRWAKVLALAIQFA